MNRFGTADIPADIARPLAHLRTGEIVGDCEDLRRALGLERWSLLGQSFGGFCTARYLSEHAQGLERAYITGGLSAIRHSIDEVYALNHEAMHLKSEKYYTRFPQDRDRMASLVEKVGQDELRTVGGDLVGPERLRSLGTLLDGARRTDMIHYLLEHGPDSWTFHYDLEQCLPFDDRFLFYVVIHEPCWADVGTTDWVAQRVRPTVFDDDPTLLTSEHVRREAFVEDAGLRLWLEVADLLAVHEQSALYDPVSLRTTAIPGAAAVYAHDAFVPVAASLETAVLILGLRTWTASGYGHDDSCASGGRVFKRLRDPAAGVIACQQLCLGT